MIKGLDSANLTSEDPNWNTRDLDPLPFSTKTIEC